MRPLERKLRTKWKPLLRIPGKIPQDLVDAYKKDVERVKEDRLWKEL